MSDPNEGWRSSSHSADNGSCVAVNFPAAGPVAVRDSKNPSGPSIAFLAASGKW